MKRKSPADSKYPDNWERTIKNLFNDYPDRFGLITAIIIAVLVAVFIPVFHIEQLLENFAECLR